MFNQRVQIIAIGFGLGFLLMLGQLTRLQLIHGDELRRQGESRLHRLEQIVPRRGSILDRNGRVLAEDKPTWDLWISPGRWTRRDGRRVEELIFGEVTTARIEDLLRAHGSRREEEERLARAYLETVHPLTGYLAAILRRRDGADAETFDEARRRVAAAFLDAAIDAVRDPSRWGLFAERLLFRDIGDRAYLTILAEQRRAPEDGVLAPLVLRGGWRRVYPLREAAAHITGYVAPLSPAEYERLRGHWGPAGPVEGEGRIPGFFEPTETEEYIIRLYETTRNGVSIRAAGHLQNDTVGRDGIERVYNHALRGAHGLRHLQLTRPDDGGARVMRVVGEPDPGRPGRAVQLTVDASVQRRVHAILTEELEAMRRRDSRPYNAACVLMHPQTGAIQALVSLPAFTPTEVNERYRDYLDPASRKPLLNRVSKGIYPPGSTFKPVVALAGLSAGAITPETEFDCEGLIHAGNHDFICMRRYAHGPIDVKNALRVSCNVFFYHTAQVLGPRELYHFARDLGFGRRTGIDLPYERPGILPETARTGVRWSLGNTYHLGIGQKLASTPLQLAVAVAAIANGGNVVRPHLLAGIEDPTPAEQARLAELQAPVRRVDLPAEALATVREGMHYVVQGHPDGRAGTGRRAEIAAMDVCGKSGSAEWRKGESTHAWFVAYAPAESPQLVVVLVVPEGDLGGSTCAPIVRRLIKAYFEIPDTEGAVG
ncbi:MAG: peptidoglycan D,D-transpeptidase FtsI family protein [Planctomycetota bacterium]